MAIIDNANPKKNPVTTLLGGVFMSISATMYFLKYVLPAFMQLKTEMPYEWYLPLTPLAIGLLLTFMNEKYFDRLFNRAERIVGKKTGTDHEPNS